MTADLFVTACRGAGLTANDALALFGSSCSSNLGPDWYSVRVMAERQIKAGHALPSVPPRHEHKTRRCLRCRKTIKNRYPGLCYTCRKYASDNSHQFAGA